MAYQAVFKRYEIKYLITREQKSRILQAMEPCMEGDEYGKTVIRNIYYDTDTYRLIRRSIEKPAYKEKLRIRSYKKAEPGSSVYVELKKKYDSVVYKRRLSMPEQKAMDWLEGRTECEPQSQISKEIDYFKDYYENLRPALFLSYEREAYCAREDVGFRVTFDDHILCRQTKMSLEEDVFGDPVLEEGKVLMEIKTSGGIPLWMTQILSKEKIYKTPFSKYGTAYQKYIRYKKKWDE
ncbi:MAG: polyphosphate polymerase domain-containing protein [Lachnospiraceae bacterium]|nr:polyphosphate polymerase domain-containing protein [Lachnospiraceae bacterium]